MSKNVDKLLQYGIDNVLAEKAASSGITVTNARTLSQKNMVAKYGLTKEEAKIISHAVKRTPIDLNTVQILLERSNYVCNICKGQKSHAYIIHHIEEYSTTQNNNYENLIVLCPNDHDLAHKGGLTLKITKDQLRKSKEAWEKQVEISNAQTAASRIQVNDDAIDYVNVNRIEELCVRLFKKIPKTTITDKLRNLKILGPTNSFDQKFVQSNLSGGRYLFDYTNCQETEHYKQLLMKISKAIEFVDLDSLANKGFKTLLSLEGNYAYFIGGVFAKGPALPINESTPPIIMYYKRKKLRIEWILDPIYLISMSAIIRVDGKNRYIVYCLIRTVEKMDDGTIFVKASPLLIAQPTKYINKTPMIAYKKQYERDVEEERFEEVWIDA
ncbi:HNH endonuclease [Desulfonema ishimotonii]|uniref:HNH endonuclease n=1 Tax=Desulfonema ishimotonii TaxID=45657 RepID=A0A401FW84_9BACT|nr:HNH endonuclease signature motif containing protein [Desulfonema ishimotonii]GBC61221.1 HNH endonuclease [Desulfonema ishimotonii]